MSGTEVIAGRFGVLIPQAHGSMGTETGGLKHNEIREHGEYRTKRLVLSAYDRMQSAEAAGRLYESPLDPAPGAAPRHRAQASGQ